MMRKITGVIGAVALTLVGVTVVSAPAQAHHNVPVVTVGVPNECGEVSFSTAWTKNTHDVPNTQLVVEVNGAVETAKIGESITVGPFNTETAMIRYRIFGGGERDYDVPAWTETDKAVINAYGAENGWSWTVGTVTPNWVPWLELTVDGCVPPPTPVMPVRPTIIQPVNCGEVAVLSLPDVDGIIYQVKIGGEWVAATDGQVVSAGKLLVKATPAKGYVFESRKQWKLWPLWAKSVSECASPVMPSHIEVTECEMPDTYEIVAAKGVRYLVDGVETDAGIYDLTADVVITAEALDGYELTDYTGPWPLTPSAVQACVTETPSPGATETPSPGATESVDPSPTASLSSSPVARSGGLPNTGQSGGQLTGIAIAGGGLIGLGSIIAALGAWLRRRETASLLNEE